VQQHFLRTCRNAALNFALNPFLLHAAELVVWILGNASTYQAIFNLTSAAGYVKQLFCIFYTYSVIFNGAPAFADNKIGVNFQLTI